VNKAFSKHIAAKNMLQGGCKINSMVSWISNRMIENCDVLVDRIFFVLFILTDVIWKKSKLEIFNLPIFKCDINDMLSGYSSKINQRFQSKTCLQCIS
jgi:hypothetical protein